jgi:hypothetical protein
VEVPIKPHLIDRPRVNRLLEIVPGFLSWLFLLLPVLLSLTYPVIVAYFIIGFDLFWLMKSLRLSFYLVRGYRRLRLNQSIDWMARLSELSNLEGAVKKHERAIEALVAKYPSVTKRLFRSPRASMKRLSYKGQMAELEELKSLSDKKATILNPKELVNVVIIATYNETIKILEPTIQSILDTNYNHKQVWLVIAYEARGGKQVSENALMLASKYRQQFGQALAIMHPQNIPGEVIGKGGNITFAGRKIAQMVVEQNISPENVIVTTLDSDNRPGKNYFANLSYTYAIDVNRVHRSFQPVAMFLNNIWDAPAPMRVIAAGNSFWNVMESMRPHRLRNFASHAQSLQALLDTDFWSVTSIVEDGHQYWRTYFTYDGDHKVVPLLSPVYQDAVLAEGYWHTFKVQYLQLRRWAWGVSDFPFVVTNAIKNKRIPWSDKLVQIFRLFEGHFSWATAPLIITFVAWLPLFLNRGFSEQVLAHELPIIAGWIMTVALIGLFVTIWISLLSLPPKPARYSHGRTLGMLAQWLLMPVTSILFSATAALDAQTRLMLGKYLDFRVTEKATKD